MGGDPRSPLEPSLLHGDIHGKRISAGVAYMPQEVVIDSRGRERCCGR